MIHSFRYIDEYSIQAGHERFHSINSSYFRGCDGAILCYDVCRQDTFANIMYHLEQVQEKGEKNAAKILVANKCDLKDLRQVTFDEGLQLSQQLNLAFFEISAKYNQQVEDAFIELARQCIANKVKEEKQKSKQDKEIKRLNNSRTSHKLTFKEVQEGIKQRGGCC